MSINRLMLLAGVLATGACGTGVLDVCTYENPQVAACNNDVGARGSSLPQPNIDPVADGMQN